VMRVVVGRAVGARLGRAVRLMGRWVAGVLLPVPGWALRVPLMGVLAPVGPAYRVLVAWALELRARGLRLLCRSRRTLSTTYRRRTRGRTGRLGRLVSRLLARLRSGAAVGRRGRRAVRLVSRVGSPGRRVAGAGSRLEWSGGSRRLVSGVRLRRLWLLSRLGRRRPRLRLFLMYR
jgi:hypothetical protein